MWFDAIVFNHPFEHRCCAVGGITNESLWLHIELILNTIQHELGALNFKGTMRGRGGVFFTEPISVLVAGELDEITGI